MKSISAFLGAACLLLAGAVAVAEDSGAAPGDTILAKLRASRPDLRYGTPQPSPLPGFYEVQVIGGPVLFVNVEATHFFAGDLFQLQPRGFINLAEQGRQQERRALLAQVPAKDVISFAPKEVKANLTVFTDFDCGYCRKFHGEVPELNRLGIAVHYLAFPRAGVGSASYRKLATAWCASDRQETLTRFKNGESIPFNVCPDNPVAKEMALGERMGVSGTPALILEDGSLVPGYRPAAELAHLLGIADSR